MNNKLVSQTSGTLETVNPFNQFLSGQLSPSTKQAYQSDIRLFLSFHKLAMDDLFKMNVSQIYSSVINYRDSISKLKDGTNFITNATTIARKITALKVFFAFLVKLGYYDRNPISDVRSPSVPTESTSEALTLSELKSVFSQIDNSIVIGKRDKAILSIMYNLGLRRSEVAKLKIEDVKMTGDFKVIRFIGKRNKQRENPLKPEVVQVIREYLSATGRSFNSKGFMFQSHSNRNEGQGNITSGTIYFMVKKYIKLANINKRISPHSFRHTAVTLALDNGSSYRDVQNMTGHSDSRLVARYDRGDKLKNNATWKLPSIN